MIPVLHLLGSERPYVSGVALPFAFKTLRLTRVISVTLRSDGTFFMDGTGVFSWERFEVRSRETSTPSYLQEDESPYRAQLGSTRA